MFNSGYIESIEDPNDVVLDQYFPKSDNLPSKYDFAKFQQIKPKDQGNTSQCVPYSMSVLLESRKMLNGDNNFRLDIKDIYDARPEKVDGMSIKDALEYMKTIGFQDITTKEREKILMYGKLTSKHGIKTSIFMNGPCIIALPVYNTINDEFWKGSELIGGHAIACVGYDEEGLILLNSWGSSWGYSGKYILPYEDINKIMECWTIIEK